MPGRSGWKEVERKFAKLIGGSRFWSNSGESVDIEGPVFLGQVKHVSKMSVNAIAQLAKDIAEEGRDNRRGDGTPDPKLGILGMTTKPGCGKKSISIVVMDESVFKELFPTGGGEK